MYMTAENTNATKLREALKGEVFAPDDSGWDAARAAWNLAIDQRPALVAFPESAADVQAAVRFAVAAGMRVAPQTTGHNAAPLGSLEHTLLLKMERMRGATIDAGSRIARAEGGAQWSDVTGPASELGLAALAGSAPDVGIVGYHLSGGLSLGLGRKYGLAVNSVVAVELITPEGRLVRADHEHEPELFWAIRGGGANFGIVTAIEFRLYPLPEVYAGMLAWPLEEAGRVLPGWLEWGRSAGDDVTTSLRLMRIPPMPELPETIRGRALVVIDGAFAGGEAGGVDAIAALRDLGPEIDTFATVPPEALGHIHMDPPEPVPAIGDHRMLGELDPQAVETILLLAGPGVETPLLMLELRQLGGALARTPAGAGAIGALRGSYAMFTTGIPFNAEVAAALAAEIARVCSELAPWDTGAPYLNFAESEVETARAFTPEVAARLAVARAAYDPEGVLRANHEI